MSSTNSPSPPSNSFLEQTVTILSSVAGYMRLPALASTVRRLRRNRKPSTIHLNAGPCSVVLQAHELTVMCTNYRASPPF